MHALKIIEENAKEENMACMHESSFHNIELNTTYNTLYDTFVSFFLYRVPILVPVQ